jgi:ATP-dependent protease Clp ATPase subunit
MKKTKIIGQESLIKEVNKIFDIFESSECEVKPHFILTGESGSGKTLTIKALAEGHNLGFLEVNAAQLTKEGISGNSLSKALSPLLQMGSKPTVVFVDEFDKLFISGNSNDSCAHESTTGVQNEFLKVLECDTASIFGDYGKYITVSSKKILFVFAGAFNGEENITLDRLREIGVKTEFLGRVGLVYSTQKLSLEDMYKIVDESPLLDKYLALFAKVDRETVVYNLKNYISKNYDMNTLGARLINTLIHQYFIKGGKLEDSSVKEITFSKKLELS